MSWGQKNDRGGKHWRQVAAEMSILPRVGNSPPFTDERLLAPWLHLVAIFSVFGGISINCTPPISSPVGLTDNPSSKVQIHRLLLYGFP